MEFCSPPPGCRKVVWSFCTVSVVRGVWWRRHDHRRLHGQPTGPGGAGGHRGVHLLRGRGHPRPGPGARPHPLGRPAAGPPFGVWVAPEPRNGVKARRKGAGRGRAKALLGREFEGICLLVGKHVPAQSQKVSLSQTQLTHNSFFLLTHYFTPTNLCSRMPGKRPCLPSGFL